MWAYPQDLGSWPQLHEKHFRARRPCWYKTPQLPAYTMHSTSQREKQTPSSPTTLTKAHILKLCKKNVLFSQHNKLSRIPPCTQTATINRKYIHQSKRDNTRRGNTVKKKLFQDKRSSKITERSGGAYTSAFARWANGWRALQWQERQRVAETQRWVNIRETVRLTGLKTHFYTLRRKHWRDDVSLLYTEPVVPNHDPLNEWFQSVNSSQCKYLFKMISKQCNSVT